MATTPLSPSARIEPPIAFRSCLVPSISILLAGLCSCGPEREVLSSTPADASSAGGFAGSGGTSGSGGADADVADAIECAIDDNCPNTMVCDNKRCLACSDLANPCASACQGSSVPVAVLRNSCPSCECREPSCYIHAQCPQGFLCAATRCTPCKEVGDHCDQTCSSGLSLHATIRNGCSLCECAPPSECTTNEDCGGDLCQAGQQCGDGSEGNPKGCYGNRCAAAGCDTSHMPCLAVGCPQGLFCESSCPVLQCKCASTTWVCEPECTDARCVPPF